MNVKLLTTHHLEFQSFKVGCTGLSEFTLVKMPHCWKSHVTAHLILQTLSHFNSDGYLYSKHGFDHFTGQLF